ncbi:proteinase inhibitor I78 [Mangrovactinospora gilvigrisea]|uniref:Proteinase inhibitor I78 n=1 Tax=Mangrovactinospora gilvigrisea TaxID=1428644 RepID=A0A1J7BAW8_9ACTN|nr:I78 family peptidase inhibitor [Mangrovactinospora gilvigrisea]OIV35795.1 proteinase inhibitor I78 [Mangrovactinospora gilvigrisea]
MSQQNAPGDATAYVGLPADEAEVRARADGWQTVRRLPKDAIVTMEFMPGRLNLTVEDGAVTRAWIG